MSLPALPQATTAATPDPGALVRWIHVLIPASQLAERIASTEFVPVAMRNKPEVVTAAIMYGDELGIGPMQALASIHVIEGRPGPSAELMRALILRGGHSLAVHQATGSVCRVSGLRAGRPEGERYHLEWNIDMARAAGLVNKAVWQRYPRGMLLARATSELGRTVFPDAIKGMGYVADDEATAAEFDSWAAGYDDSTDTVPAPPPPPAVKRKPRKKVPPATAEEVLPEQAPAGAPEPEFDPRPPVAPAAEPAPGEAMVGASTRAAILATYATIRGLPDDSRETRLRLFSAIVGHPVESTNALTRHEAFRLLRVLTDLQTGAVQLETDADGDFRVWPADEPPDVPWDQPPLLPEQ
jgi:hypothetical protein